MKRYKIVLFVVLVLGVAFVVWQQRTAPYWHNEGRVFGTYYSVTYQNESDLQREIVAVMEAVDGSMSMFNPESTIAKLNGGVDTTLDAELLYLLPRAEKVSQATDGAFDVTVAPLVNVWGFGFREERWPTSETIDSILEMVGHEKIRIEGKHLVKDDARTMIDLSAIAKGFGVDKVAEMLEKENVRNYLVEIGGDIRVKGKGESGKNWRIGVNKVEEPGEEGEGERGYQCVLELTDCAVATSGNYRNFYDKDGVRYAHTIDPKTGRPVQRDVLSASVVAKDCWEADAYATSIMVMGLEKTQEMAEREKQLDVYVIYEGKDGQEEVWMSKGMEKYVKK